MQRRYGSKFFRIYIPQVHDSQTDNCLFARKRVNKYKYRFRYGNSFQFAVIACHTGFEY